MARPGCDTWCPKAIRVWRCSIRKGRLSRVHVLVLRPAPPGLRLRMGDTRLKKQRDKVKSNDGTRGLKVLWIQSPENLVNIIFIRSKQLRKKCDQRGGALDTPCAEHSVLLAG